MNKLYTANGENFKGEYKTEYPRPQMKRKVMKIQPEEFNNISL